MIRDRFYKMFSLEVMHTYYINDICKGLIYNPTKNTESIIKRFSLKLNLTTKGFEFYTDTKKSITSLLNYITKVTGEESFNFNAITVDSQFYQFTNLPINQIGVIKYNSSSNEVVSDTTVRVLKPEFIPTIEANELFSLSVKFQDLIKSDENKNSSIYKIEFTARDTQWKYFILNNTNQHLGNLSIKCKSEVEFEGPIEVILQNGEKAQLFSSEKQLLPLSEAPKYNFDLMSTIKKNGVNRNKILFKGLPNPNPNIIKIDSNKTETIVASLMYIYV